MTFIPICTSLKYFCVQEKQNAVELLDFITVLPGLNSVENGLQTVDCLVAHLGCHVGRDRKNIVSVHCLCKMCWIFVILQHGVEFG